MKAFASDNYAGVHPEVLQSLVEANSAHEISYGDDIYTLKAKSLFREIFGDVDVYFTFNGTGANVVALKCCTLPFQSIVCTNTAHIHSDECGAPVQSLGSSLITIPTNDGKLTPELIQPFLSQIGNVHNTQPKVISISQSTELGTVYSTNEIKALCDFAHQHQMFVHLDGARISNAVAALGTGLREATADCGVDIMSFGGTKNGLMMGEAVLIFNDELKANAPYFHKQTGQLFSKNRYISAQFVALLQNDLWRRIALQANAQAQKLAKAISAIPCVKISRSVDANAVFVILPAEIIPVLQTQYRFYVWNEQTHECRWMCSFDTTDDDINGFVDAIQNACRD